MANLQFVARCAIAIAAAGMAAITGSGTQQQGPKAPAPVELRDQAWKMLRDAAQDKEVKHRADALKAMGILRPSADAVKLVEDGLDDKSPVVREAAARSLGEMRSTTSISKLQAAVDDKDFGVSLAATAALVEMKNDAGYDADFELLTGARKSGEPLTQQASRTLHDRDKMVTLSIEQGMGFAPFGGFAVAAFEALKKNSTAPVRAAAALALAHDPDERSAKALVIATGDKDWIVRVAAIRAIGMRDDAALAHELKAPLEDKHDAVQYSAAASIIRLSPANAPAAKH